jgi:hypothetical protein
MAFDGQVLYASSASGLLFTLDPNTGVVLSSLLLPPLLHLDGSPAPYVFDIAAVPEPGVAALLIVALAATAGRRLMRRGMVSTGADAQNPYA